MYIFICSVYPRVDLLSQRLGIHLTETGRIFSKGLHSHKQCMGIPVVPTFLPAFGFVYHFPCRRSRTESQYFVVLIWHFQFSQLIFCDFFCPFFNLDYSSFITMLYEFFLFILDTNFCYIYLTSIFS